MSQISIKSRLLLELANGPGHERALAKRIAASQPTVARLLRTLERESILVAEQQGKNTVYRLAETYAARHALAAAEHEKTTTFLTSHPRAAGILEQVLKSTDAALVLLFGSYATGTERESSDLDLYVSTDKEGRDALNEFHSKLRIQAGTLDISSGIGQEIIRKHVILRGIDDFLTLTRPERKWQAAARDTLGDYR